MKSILIIIVILHGLLHTLGFLMAYNWVKTKKHSITIKRTIGIYWLFVGILIISSTILIFLNIQGWVYLAFISIFLSQILIILHWKDAKFGTIINLVFLIFSVMAFGESRFNEKTQAEIAAFINDIKTEEETIINKEDISHLPKIVQKWMMNSNVTGKEISNCIYLTQKGSLRTSSKGKWMPFTAYQYFNCNDPSFIWVSQLSKYGQIILQGRDGLIKGQGQMHISLFSLIPVVNKETDEKIDAASMQRFLAELCWFPSAATRDYIFWENIDDTTARATLILDNKSVSGVYTFTKEGMPLSFETKRYFSDGKDSRKEKWLVEMNEYKEFNGIEIPNRCNVTWQLESGDYHWLQLEITSLEKNRFTFSY